MNYSAYESIKKGKAAIRGNLLLLLEQSGSFMDFRHQYLSRIVVDDFYMSGSGKFRKGISSESIKDVLLNSFSSDHFEKMFIDCCIPVMKPLMSGERKKEIGILARDFLDSRLVEIKSRLSEEKDDYARVGIIQSVFIEWKNFADLENSEILHNNVKSWMALARTSYSLKNIKKDPLPIMSAGDIPAIFKRAGESGQSVDHIIDSPSFLGNAYLDKKEFGIFCNYSSGAEHRRRTNFNGNIHQYLKKSKIQEALGIKPIESSLMLQNSCDVETSESKIARHVFFRKATDKEVILSSPIGGSLFVDLMAKWSMACFVSPNKKMRNDMYRFIETETRDVYMCIPTWAVVQRYILSSSTEDFDKDFMRALISGHASDRQDWKSSEDKLFLDIVSDLKRLDVEKTVNNPDHYHRLHPALRTAKLEETSIRGNPLQLLDDNVSMNLIFDETSIESLKDIGEDLSKFQAVAFCIIDIGTNPTIIRRHYEIFEKGAKIEADVFIDLNNFEH